MALPHSDWPRLKEVFAGARALPADKRPAYLAAACDGNDALRQEVESLLSSDERAKGFLEAPAVVRADDSSVTRNLEGHRMGPYLIGLRIGAGGMGEVYQARDTTLNRQVAIKVLLPAVAGDPDRLVRFRREARVLASLNHQHIAQIHGFEDAAGVHALVMELVEGPTLADRIADGAIPINEALAIASQIADALEAAHEQGIIHRDLKPANIKVRDDGTVKVLDFGLAKGPDVPSSAGDILQSPTLTADATVTGLIIGTAAYMSPEQARGKAVDRRADLWAFGCVLYEMLTRRRAFGGDTPTDVLVAVVTTEPEWTRLPAETPAAIRTLLRRCLEKNRARRLDSAVAARLEIDDALATLAARPVVAPERIQPPATAALHSDRVPFRRRRQRRWTIVAGVTAVAVLAAAGAVWRLWQQDYFWRNPLADATVERLTDFDGEEADAAISPDGKFMMFLSDRDGPFDAWISQIGSGESVNLTRGRFQLMNNPNTRMTGFSGDGAQVWFTQQVSARPLKWTAWISPALGGTPRTFLEGGLEPIWSPDGKNVVYHTNDLGDPIFVADRNGSNPRQIFVSPPGTHGHYLTWSPDGRFIYFVKGTLPTDELDIWRIPVSPSGAAAAPERITSHNARVAYPAFLDARTLIYSATAEDGSGQWLYAVDVEHRIPHRVSSGIAQQYLSVDVSRARPRRVITTVAIPTASLWAIPISDRVQPEAAATRVPTPNTRARGPRFAPGYLAFLSSKGSADGLWKIESGAPMELWRGEDGGVVAPPAVSPDGRQICFSYRIQGASGLYVMNANGTNVRTLAADSFDVRGAASWSPDGKWVAVAANRGDGTRLFKIPVDGGPPVRLLDTLSYNPVWSPDGRFILYSEQQSAGQFEVKAITPDRAPVPIVELQIVGFSPRVPYRFLPDGKGLVVLEGVLGLSQNFFRIELATGHRRQLTDLRPGSVIHNFDVSPDGTQIVFDRLRNNTDIVSMNLAR